MNDDKYKDIILRMVANFPGLVNDSEVSGSELVEWMCNEVFALLPDKELEDRAKYGTPNDEDDE